MDEDADLEIKVIDGLVCISITIPDGVTHSVILSIEKAEQASDVLLAAIETASDEA